MTRRKQKPNQVEKVSAETGVDAADLERLPVDALQKLDDLVPDTEEFPDEEEDLELIESSDDAYVNGKELLGYHPITLEPVYK